jgi:CRISPR-associated protein Cmr1
MKNITFTCEIITPLYMFGATDDTLELRAPSIKGVLRFWWRAMNAHLSLSALQEREGFIFGNTQQRSKIIIRIENASDVISEMRIKDIKPIEYRNFARPAFEKGQFFNIHFQILPNPYMSMQVFEQLWILTCLLGGFGARSRRGCGCIRIVAKNDIKYSMPTDYDTILKYLNEVNRSEKLPFFKKSVDKRGRETIVSTFSTLKNVDYPYIKQIQLGRPQSNLPIKIADTANRFHRQDRRNYENSLGRATPRWASPIYVSVFKDDKDFDCSIITTLLAVSGKKEPVNYDLQENFKNALL